MSLLISGFEGLVARDFDVYQPACWSNNLHNLDRMRTKARVKILAERAAAALSGDWEVETSSEVPSIWNGRQVRDQWAYAIRPRSAREPMLALLGQGLDLAQRIKDPAEHHQHVLLSVQIDQAHIEVGLRLHARAQVDLRNLIARADAEPEAFAAAITALPESVELDGATPDAARILGAARSTLAGDREWLAIVQRWEKDAAVDLGEALMDATARLAEGLAPLLAFVAWSPENDHAGAASKLDAFAAAVDERASQVEAARAAKVSSHQAREEAARDRTAARLAELTAWKKARPRRPRGGDMPPSAQQRRPARDEDEPRRARAKRDTPPARPRNANQARLHAARGSKRPPRAAKPRPDAARPAPRQPTTPARPLAVGDTCRLNRGLLAGKTGEITSIDAKKGVFRVKVGALEVNLSAGDIERMG